MNEQVLAPAGAVALALRVEPARAALLERLINTKKKMI